MFISSEAIVNATSAVVRASLHRRADEEEEEVNCGEGGGDDAFLGLRIASVFIILVGSTFGALFPVLAKRAKWLTIPKSVFEYVPSLSASPIIELNLPPPPQLRKVLWIGCHRTSAFCLSFSENRSDLHY